MKPPCTAPDATPCRPDRPARSVRQRLRAALEAGRRWLRPDESAAADAPFAVLAYDVTVRPDFEAERLAGRQTIRVRSTADGTGRLTFHAGGPEILWAAVAGRRVRVRRRRRGLIVVLNRPLAAGEEAVLQLRTRTTGGRGAVFVARGVYTTFWSGEWMVCRQKAFGEAAAVVVTVEVPAAMTVLSVGRPVETTDLGGGYRAHCWRCVRPYPAHLIGFAAGHFEVRQRAFGATTLSVIDAAGLGADHDAAFDDWGAMVGFLSAKAGLPLPLETFQYLIVPGSAAQEAATYATLGAEEVRASAKRPECAWAVIHELAHQWWGNLVRCRDVSQLWLNEGVVVFLSAAWKERRFGRVAYDSELAIGRRRLSKARARGGDHVLDYAGAYESLSMQRAVQYSKGALFLDHLRRGVGETAFWAGLRAHTVAGAGRTVSTADFLAAMAASGGRPLEPLLAGYLDTTVADAPPRAVR